MNDLNFTEDDKQKVIEFLNCIAKNAEFTVKTGELINYFKLLSHMQQTILPKINHNIFEIKKIVEPEKKEPTKKAPSKAKK